MAKVELKQPVVDEIAGIIKDAQSVVLVNYSGLTVEQDTIMRRELRESGITYKVFKNGYVKEIQRRIDDDNDDNGYEDRPEIAPESEDEETEGEYGY